MPRTFVLQLADFMPSGPKWEDLPNDEGLVARVPLTWTGVREYPNLQIETEDGSFRAARVLRRPEQVLCPAHLRTLERLYVTHDHPIVDGEQVRVTPDNYRQFQVGQTGDTIDCIERGGYPVPAAKATVTGRSACESIRAGNTQTSLGYTAMIAPPPADEMQPDYTGIWEGPHGPEPYDLEHLLDPSDPRVVAYAEADPAFDPALLGGNHLAAAIPLGRGGQLSELLAFSDKQGNSFTGNPTLFFTDKRTNMADSKTETRTLHVVDIAPPKGTKLPRFTADMDPELAAKVREHITAISQLLEQAMGEKDEMAEKVESAEGAQEAAANEKAELEVKLADVEKEMGELKEENDSLRREVEPLREKALADAKALAVKLGAPKDETDSAKTLADVRKVWATAKAPRAAERGDAAVLGAWDFAVDSLAARESNQDENDSAEGSRGADFNDRLGPPNRDKDSDGDAPKGSIAAALDAING